MNRTSPDITVVIVSSDPFFCFATLALLHLGQSPKPCVVARSLADVCLVENNTIVKSQVLVCDLDAMATTVDFYDQFVRLVEQKYFSKVICIAERNIEQASFYLADIPINGFLSKRDLRYSIHLAIRAVVENNAVVLTPNSYRLIEPGTFLHLNGKVIAPESLNPLLSKRIYDIVLWCALLGPDNHTIQDELYLESLTIKANISEAYKLLGVDNDKEAFEALSDWWWQSRFYPVIE